MRLFYVVVWLFITPESSTFFCLWVLGVLPSVIASVFSQPSLFLELCVECHTLTDKSSQIKDCQPCSLQMERKKGLPGALHRERGCV